MSVWNEGLCCVCCAIVLVNDVSLWNEGLCSVCCAIVLVNDVSLEIKDCCAIVLVNDVSLWNNGLCYSGDEWCQFVKWSTVLCLLFYSGGEWCQSVKWRTVLCVLCCSVGECQSVKWRTVLCVLCCSGGEWCQSVKWRTVLCVFQINDQVPEGMSSLFSDPVLSQPSKGGDDSTPVVSSCSLLKLSNTAPTYNSLQNIQLHKMDCFDII